MIVHRFLPNYTCWNKHGEEGPNERGEWVADTQEGCRDDDQDGQGNCDQEGCRDDFNEECMLEFSEHQFDALVDNVEEMIHDVRGEHEMTEAELCKYKQFVEDSKKPLYLHCEKYSRVTGDLKLLQLNAAHGWTDKSFKALLLLLKDMLSEETCYRILCMRPSRLCVLWDWKLKKFMNAIIIVSCFVERMKI